MKDQSGSSDGSKNEEDGPSHGPTLGAATRRRGRLLGTLFAIALGVFAGTSIFTFGYGKGASYLSNNPESCVNCHAMQSQYDSWQHSSHHHVAVCNDCHLPHDAVGKWVTKADNGFFHSFAFTMGGYADPIQIKPRNRRVTQSTCVGCHRDFVHSLMPLTADQDMTNCVHCHSAVGHADR